MSFKFLFIFLILFSCIFSVSAFTLSGTKTSTVIDSTSGAVEFKTVDNKFLVSTDILLDDKIFLPSEIVSTTKDITLSTNTIVIKYIQTEDTLKETITIKQDIKLSFPIRLSPDTKMIEWDNGQWKIVSSKTDNTMDGLVVSKPYGIDAIGNYIDMNYKYDGNALNLEYDKLISIWSEDKAGNITLVKQTPITYPLTIDPSFTLVGGCWTKTDGAYTIMKWNTTGKTSWTIPTGITTIEYLVIAGGGGAGVNNGGGGGGGGFLVNATGTGYTVTAGSIVNVTVGAGGAVAASENVAGSNGRNSSFANTTPGDGINAKGGGGGGGRTTGKNGIAGGSGGGAGGKETSSLGGHGTSLQGYDGGDANSDGGQGAGGGGAGVIGGDGGSSVGGNGGNGLQSNITGILTYYAGGGGGGAGGDDHDHAPSASGGLGGGGAGKAIRDSGGAAVAGTDGLGGGGGSSGSAVASDSKGGGSGVVIIRYLTYHPIPIASFTYAPTAGISPLTVQFNDTSSNTPISWKWAIKNETVSSWSEFSMVQNPTYIFTQGNWSVNLSATNAYGTNISLSSWVNVSTKPIDDIIIIPHTLGHTPGFVLVTTSIEKQFASVLAKNATTFSIAITKYDGTKGNAQYIYWCVG